MADPFEVRMRFTSQLQSMNASVNSAQKAAHFALRYRDMQEDLHSCILEQLEQSTTIMNTRANIMYFIEHLCDMAQQNDQLDFVRMMQRDIFRVVDAVAPSDGSGAANVKVVRRVLNGLQQKSVLALDTVSELEASLKERDTLPVDTMETNGHTSSSRSARPNGLGRLDKKQIEQRIEEDRERHKRLKESMWGVAGDRENAALKLFEEGSDCGDDDLLIAVEDELDTGKTTGPG